jgi:long-chain acyl-CoA synthetase
VAELAKLPEVTRLIEGEIEERNRLLASFESIKRFHILPRDFSIEDGEMTPTLKIKRKVVVSKFQNELESLYE